MSERPFPEGPTPKSSTPKNATQSGRMAAILALVAERLAMVEERVEANLRSEIAPIDHAGRALSEGGGKLLRPALILLVARLLGYEGRHDVELGAVFELIHTATLVHDDIIDEADTRRGRPSLHRVVGNEQAILVGDFLYIRSMNLALAANKLSIIATLAEATERLIEGELLAAHLRGRDDVGREQHLEIIQRKTAWLFSGCCRAAAQLGDAPPASVLALGRYGMELGTAFQLVDDLLDVTGDREALGKPAAADLCEGRLTLPFIDLLECGNEAERAAVRGVLAEGQLGAGGFAALRDALEARGCLERSRTLAAEYAARAGACLAGLPEGPARDALAELPELILARQA